MATKTMLAVRKNVFEDEMLLYMHTYIVLTIICFRALTISVADLHGGSGGSLEHHSGKNISLGNL